MIHPRPHITAVFKALPGEQLRGDPRPLHLPEPEAGTWSLGFPSGLRGGQAQALGWPRARPALPDPAQLTSGRCCLWPPTPPSLWALAHGSGPSGPAASSSGQILQVELGGP